MFIDDVFRKVVLEIFDKFVSELQANSTLTREKSDYFSTSMNHFKESSHLFQNFIQSKKYESMKYRGDLGFLDKDAIHGHQQKLRKLSWFTAIDNLCRTNEFGVLYPSFSIRTVCTSDVPKT